MKKINIKNILEKNQTTLAIMPSVEYNDDVVNLAKQISEKSTCYVTLNKTNEALLELFRKHKVNVKNIIFIDAISKSLKNAPDQNDQTYFVSSPGALTELSITINKFLKHNFEYLIFDSVSTLAIYEKKEPIAKFISSLVNKIKESNTKAIFYAIQSKDDDDLIKQCSLFVDEVIEVK